MTVAQAIYLGALAVYLVFFVLFCRFFIWKRYAERNFWHQRPSLSMALLERLACERGRELPYLTIVVPARNEAEVIGRTIEHMTSLTYGPGRWGLLIVTDEKETVGRNARLLPLLDGVFRILDERSPWRTEQELTALAGVLAPFVAGVSNESLRELGLPGAEVPANPLIVRDLAVALTLSGGRLSEQRLEGVVRCGLPGSEAATARSVLPLYISLALPVVAACHVVAGEPARVKRLIRAAARAHHRLTADILEAFTLRACAELLAQLRRLEPSALRQRVCDSCVLVLPTTEEVVAREFARLSARPGGADLKQVAVPYDFDGTFPGQRTGRLVPSTKGRALNYALGRVDERTEICGFYDAESRPHPEVLMYVAYRYLTDAEPVPIFQGPVFQVRNFYSMGPFCKIASLYQAIAHDWYLPALFRRLPFVGGTNLFVRKQLLADLGGFARNSLTEDLELGIRAYLKAGAWPEYLPYHSSEQTPPTMRAFMRQRLRWGSGHLQVVDEVRSATGAEPGRRRQMLRQLFVKGQLEWCLYQAATLVPPAVVVLWYRGLVDVSLVPAQTRLCLHSFTLTYFLFTIYAYYRYRPYLEHWMAPKHKLRHTLVLAQLLLLPFAAFLFPVPYTYALLLKSVGRQPRSWTKTPRTRE
jgi:cellulose synthase/poly-beta-1,6-N-acetylglucosamine synthase-like glycosyltransferase